MTPFGTAQDFLDRRQGAFVREILGVAEGDAFTVEALARITKAMTDASAELAAYKPSIAAARWPAAETLLIHTVKVATYLLTLDRPGKEFEQVRNAYTDTIKFYTDAVTATASATSSPIDGVATVPEPVFTETTLKGFV